jgi:hypothetical protein
MSVSDRCPALKVRLVPAAKVLTQFVMLSDAKHLPGNQRPFAEFILRHEGLRVTTR